MAKKTATKTSTKKTTAKKVTKKTEDKKIVIKYSLQEELARIQTTIKAPKNQKNDYGGFDYRSAEDILTGYKLVQGKTIINLSDEIVQVGNRTYVKATATITLGEESKSVSAFAREPDAQKGMNESQITGSASSYARKYALNGLLAIDDNKDADVPLTPEQQKEQSVMEAHAMEISMIDDIKTLGEYYNSHKEDEDIVIGELNVMVTKRKRKLEAELKSTE